MRIGGRLCGGDGACVRAGKGRAGTLFFLGQGGRQLVRESSPAPPALHFELGARARPLLKGCTAGLKCGATLVHAGSGCPFLYDGHILGTDC